MAKECGHKVPCGCGDKALTTPPPCNASGSCAGETCSELFAQECIVYTGEDMEFTVGGVPVIIAEKGDRIPAILQKLMNMTIGEPALITDAPQNVKVTNITSTGFKVTFDGLATLAYSVNAQLQSPLTSNIVALAIGAAHEVVYTGLVSGGTYKIKTESSLGGWQGITLVVTLP